MQTTAIHTLRAGGPDVLQVTTVDVGDPGPGEVRIRQSAIGLNFADIYQRRGGQGVHQAGPYPMILGSEGAGVVEATGEGVESVKVGQSVAYIQGGAYQAIRNVSAARVVCLPPGQSEEMAGANLARGLTAEYLLRRLYSVKPGHTILVHAAAGGLGVILAQWAKALGATVIGTVGSDDKLAFALGNGCDYAINYRTDDFAARAMDITCGKGVDVVYDAVGKDVFVQSLHCLRPLGLAINYGTASGDVVGFDLNLLHSRSLSVARPTLLTFIANPADMQAGAAALFDAVGKGMLKLEVTRRYPLTEVRRAHEELESRKTTGASVLLP